MLNAKLVNMVVMLKWTAIQDIQCNRLKKKWMLFEDFTPSAWFNFRPVSHSVIPPVDKWYYPVIAITTMTHWFLPFIIANPFHLTVCFRHLVEQCPSWESSCWWNIKMLVLLWLDEVFFVFFPPAGIGICCLWRCGFFGICMSVHEWCTVSCWRDLMLAG